MYALILGVFLVLHLGPVSQWCQFFGLLFSGCCFTPLLEMFLPVSYLPINGWLIEKVGAFRAGSGSDHLEAFWRELFLGFLFTFGSPKFLPSVTAVAVFPDFLFGK